MTVIISQPTKEDFENLLGQLIAVYESAYEGLPEYAYQGKAEIKEYLEWLYDGDPQGFFVAYNDGQPVAFESVHGSWKDRQGNIMAEIHEIVVSRDEQGKGIGGKLLRLALDYAKSRGRDTVSLWVGEKNYAAAAIYKRLGFKYVSSWGIWHRMILRLPKVDEGRKDSGQSV